MALLGCIRQPACIVTSTGLAVSINRPEARPGSSGASSSCRATQAHETGALGTETQAHVSPDRQRLLHAHRRMQQLQEAKDKSEARLKALRAQEGSKALDSKESASNAVCLKKTVDRRVYDQVSASRNRLSQQLSAKNRYIRHLETMIAERMQAVEVAHKTVVRVGSELESIRRLSDVAIAALVFGVAKEDAVARTERIIRRADTLQEGVRMEADKLDKLVARRIPVEWYGVATEVKLMGSFDGWTEGFSLSPSEIQDQTFTCYKASLLLLPGRYEVKFKVDDANWRLAPDWPTVTSADGSTNNVLTVN